MDIFAILLALILSNIITSYASDRIQPFIGRLLDRISENRRKKAAALVLTKQKLQTEHPELWDLITVIEADQQSSDFRSTGVSTAIGFAINFATFALGVVLTKNHLLGF